MAHRIRRHSRHTLPSHTLAWHAHLSGPLHTWLACAWLHTHHCACLTDMRLSRTRHSGVHHLLAHVLPLIRRHAWVSVAGHARVHAGLRLVRCHHLVGRIRLAWRELSDRAGLVALTASRSHRPMSGRAAGVRSEVQCIEPLPQLRPNGVQHRRWYTCSRLGGVGGLGQQSPSLSVERTRSFQVFRGVSNFSRWHEMVAVWRVVLIAPQVPSGALGLSGYDPPC